MNDLLAHLEEPSFFTEKGFHKSVLSELLDSNIDRDCLGELKHVAFVLLKPDAVAARKCHRVVDFLAQHDMWVVFAVPVVTPQLAQFEALYQFNLTKSNDRNQFGSWWLNSQTYTIGPSVALLLTDFGKYASIHQKLSELKGPSTPHHGRSGQLRFDLSATNRAINLIHAADDPLSTAREFLLFDSKKSLGDVLHKVRSAVQGDTVRDLTSAGLRTFELALDGLPMAQENLDLLDVLLSMKQRLVTLLPVCSSRETIRDRLSSLNSHCSIERQVGLQQFENRCCEYFSALRRNVEPLLEQFKAETIPQQYLVSLLKRFCEPRDFSPELAQEVVAFFTAKNLYISNWERLVCLSSFHYAVDYSDIWHKLSSKTS